jgi:hypothetical protein
MKRFQVILGLAGLVALGLLAMLVIGLVLGDHNDTGRQGPGETPSSQRLVGLPAATRAST